MWEDDHSGVLKHRVALNLLRRAEGLLVLLLMSAGSSFTQMAPLATLLDIFVVDGLVDLLVLVEVALNSSVLETGEERVV